MRPLPLVLALLLALAFSPALAAESVEVRVGGYCFPPFVMVEDGRAAGLIPDLIQALNRRQDKWRFTFAPTSPRRRYSGLESARYDAMFFEDVKWGWRDWRVTASESVLFGAEDYIALKEPGRGQDFFRDVGDRKLAGVLGYHYGFANFTADPDVLRRQFDIVLAQDPSSVIRAVLKGRAEVGLVTDAYLRTYERLHPGTLGRLIVADHSDQIYRHVILTRKHFRPSAGEIAALIREMMDEGELDRLFARWGIHPPRP